MNDPSLPIELPPSEHAHGCPDPPGRTESYELTRSDGQIVVVTRCVTCGGQSIAPKEETTNA